MTRFYEDLFAGKLGYTEVASFRSEPGLLGVRLDDVSAEEAFWVYDHPPFGSSDGPSACASSRSGRRSARARPPYCT